VPTAGGFDGLDCLALDFFQHVDEAFAFGGCEVRRVGYFALLRVKVSVGVLPGTKSGEGEGEGGGRRTVKASKSMDCQL
jgi:hypothetical protein